MYRSKIEKRQADGGSKLRLQVDGSLVGACIQRTVLAEVGAIEFRPPRLTAAE